MKKSFLCLAIFISMILQGCSLKNITPTFEYNSEFTDASAGGIDIISSSSFFDSYSGYHVVGELINNLDVAVTSIQLNISIVDSSGYSLLKDESENIVDKKYFLALFNTLEIGENSPFSFYFDASNGLPASYQVQVESFETTTTQRAQWSRENVQIFDNGAGYFVLTGEIVNQSPDWMTIKTLAGGVRDDMGKVLSVEKMGTYVSTLFPAGDISQRDRTPFSIQIPIPLIAVTQWDIWCETEVRPAPIDYPITIETKNIYTDEFHSLHLVGTITNNSESSVSSPIVAGLFTSDGSVLDVSYLLPFVAIPGGKSLPFEITNFGSFEWTDERTSLITSYRANIDPDRIESSQLVTELIAENEIVENAGFTWTVRGNFINSTTNALNQVTSLVSIYSTEGTLLAMGYGYSYPSDGKYLPGATGEYEVLIYLPIDIDTSTLYSTSILLADISE